MPMPIPKSFNTKLTIHVLHLVCDECGLTPDLLFFRLSHPNHAHTRSAFLNFWRSLIFNNYRHITIAG